MLTLGGRSREAYAATAAVVAACALLWLLNDPVGVGSRGFYLYVAIGVSAGILKVDDVEGRLAGFLVGATVALGGVLVGVGTLPLSHPLTEPVHVEGLVSEEGGIAAITGTALFVLGLFGPRVYARVVGSPEGSPHDGGGGGPPSRP